MTCETHPLCEDDYRAMVDAGEAKPEPVGDGNGDTCCVCGAPAAHFLRAHVDRFGSLLGGSHRRHDENPRANADHAAMNQDRPRAQVVQTDQPQVGQEMQPS
jgi:hypothetical protein